MHRSCSQDCINLIKRFEGFSPVPYRCPAGWMTFGYGSLLKNYNDVPFPITTAQAEEYLRKDVYIAERAVLRLINVPLTISQYDALVSFTYNLGGGNLQSSTLRRKVNREEHGEIPYEFRKWVWAGGKKLPGLVTRREAEAALYGSA